MGRGSSDDKFTLAEIANSKRVTFDDITGVKIGGDYWEKFMNGSNGNMCIPMDTNAPEVIGKKMYDTLLDLARLEQARRDRPDLSDKQKVTCLSDAFAKSVAQLESGSAEQLRTVGDPWIVDKVDTRCPTGALFKYRSIDGSGYTEANNLMLDSFVVSNSVGRTLGAGTMIDGACMQNEVYRRRAGTESDFVHHDRDLAMRRNVLSMECHGKHAYPNLLDLQPDDPGVIIVCDFPASYWELSTTKHVHLVQRMQELAERARLKARRGLLEVVQSRASTLPVAVANASDAAASPRPKKVAKLMPPPPKPSSASAPKLMPPPSRPSNAPNPIKADKAQKKLTSLASWAVKRGCPDSCHAYLKQVRSKKGDSDQTMRGFKHQKGCAVAYAIDAIRHAPSKRVEDPGTFKYASKGPVLGRT